jgi:hypothetical protein
MKTSMIFSRTTPIESGKAETRTAGRASARFTVNRVNAIENDKPRKSSRRSGVNAALRIAPVGNRYARRRFFAPSHTFEHRLP